jgi:2-methylcitrate dehydratase PrpD
VGVTLTRRRAGLAEFSDAAVADAAVRALGGKVTFVDDAGMSIDAAQVRVRFDDGHSLVTRIDAARGSLARLLTDQELAAKLCSLCEYGGSGVAADRLMDAVWTLDRQRDAGSILALAVPTTI